MPTLDSPRARSSPPPRILNTARNTAVWASEAAFFDAQAVAAAGRVQAGVPRDVLERYRHPTRPWYNKEFRFRLLGDVDGVRILDVGCGSMAPRTSGPSSSVRSPSPGVTSPMSR
jgi:hypothetical protein